MMSIDKRTLMFAGIGAIALGAFAYKTKSAKGKKLAFYAIAGALAGATVEVVGVKMILKK